MKLSEISEGDEIVATTDLKDWSCLEEGKVYKVQKDQYQPHRHSLYINCKCGLHYLMVDENASHFSPFIARRGGWIGVDLDGTLAVYDKWRGPYHIGEPIQPMVDRVRQWLSEDRDVRIFTARVTQREKNEDGTPHDIGEVVEAISKWLKAHIGRALPITNVKDWSMVELWDDRCVQMVPNTGKTLAEEHEAVRMAEAGKAASA